MGKGTAGSRRNSVALLACVALASTRLAFPADLANQPAAAPSTAASATTPAAVQSDAAVDSQPEAGVEFLGGADKPGGKKSDAVDAPAKKGIFSTVRLAPIAMRVGGSVGYSISRMTTGKEPPVIQEMLSTNLDVYATSYLWQPWFAKVEGQLFYTNNIASTNSGRSAGHDVPSSTVSGEAKLRIFPMSRYPFEAALRQSESFTGYGVGAPNTQTNMLRLTQSYAPRDRKEQYRAALTRTITGGMNLPKERQDALNFDASTRRFAKQSHSLTAESNRSYGSKDKVLLTNRLVSRHDYKPDADFSLNGMGNVNYLSQHTSQSALNTTNMQLSGFASWLPKDQPYSLVSSLRAIGANSVVNDRTSSTLQGVYATLGGAYTVNRYLSLSANGNYYNVVSNGQRTKRADLASSQDASVNYPFPSINFGDLRYTRGISGRFSNRANTTAAPSVQTVTVSPSHALARSMKWMEGNLGMNLSQGLTVSKASRAPENASLRHQGSAGWTRVDGKQTSNISLMASDARTLLGVKSNSQMINLQGMLNTELDRNSSWSGDLTVQTARSGDAQMMSPWIASSSANLAYRNRRMFNVNRMEFRSDLHITSKSLLPVLAGANEPADIIWDNKLTYMLGRMEFSLQGSITQAQKTTTTLLMFNAIRSFGRK